MHFTKIHHNFTAIFENAKQKNRNHFTLVINSVWHLTEGAKYHLLVLRSIYKSSEQH